MDQSERTRPLPLGWADSIARAEADLVADRVVTLDLDSFCQQIEADADQLERNIAARHKSPA